MTQSLGPDDGDRRARELVMVRCHACQARFPAGVQVDRASLEAMVITARYRCPTCGHEESYVKADHFFVLDEAPDDPGSK